MEGENISIKSMALIMLMFFFLLTAVGASDNQTATNETVQVNENITHETIVKDTSKIKASDYTAYVGVKNTYKVVLTSENKPLSKKTIKFSVNGKTTLKTTNQKGEASINLNLPKGTYTIRYSYDGDGKTLKSSGQAKITVKQTSKVSVKKANSLIYRNLKSDYFKIKVTDVRSDPIKNVKVLFKISKKKYTKKTNANGIALIKIKLKTGSYTVKVTSQKTSNFLKSYKTFKIKVKPKQARNNGIWLFSTDMDSVNFKILEKYGTKHIFLNAKSLENHGKTAVEKFIRNANAHKIKVHIWMQVFYSAKNGWVNPVKNSKINYDLINKKVNLAKDYAKIKGVSGVHFDYIRLPGNAYKYPGAVKAINYFTKKASAGVHKISGKLIVSAAMMPEPSSMKKHYAQDIPAMSRYLDVIVPMAYKGNYHAGTGWIKTVTKTFARQSKHAKIWTGIQTYAGDTSLKKLTSSQLMKDADAAALGGAYGVILFRYGLINYINFNNV